MRRQGQVSWVDPKTRDPIRHTPDLLTSKLPALLLYQLGLTTDVPATRRGSAGIDCTTPHRGLWHHQPCFDTGRTATFEAVVDHSTRVLGLSLKPQQRSDVVHFLESL